MTIVRRECSAAGIISDANVVIQTGLDNARAGNRAQFMARRRRMMTMAEPTPLAAAIDALEKATEGNDILNTLIAEAVGDDLYALTRNYTTSLDAALTLLPTDWGWSVGEASHPKATGAYTAWLYRKARKAPTSLYADAPTAALALCLAALRARQQGSE
jgi:hypothetical protein